MSHGVAVRNKEKLNKYKASEGKALVEEDLY